MRCGSRLLDSFHTFLSVLSIDPIQILTTFSPCDFVVVALVKLRAHTNRISPPAIFNQLAKEFVDTAERPWGKLPSPEGQYKKKKEKERAVLGVAWGKDQSGRFLTSGIRAKYQSQASSKSLKVCFFS